MKTSTVNVGQEMVPAGRTRIVDRRKARSKNRPETAAPAAVVPDEALVEDDRASVRPAQAIESKLARLLQEASIPVSHLQTRGLLRTR